MVLIKTAAVGMALVPMAATADPLAVLVNYGALGIFLICILTGLVRTRSEVENRDKQLEQLQKTIENQQRMIDAFTMNLTGQTIPALARSTQVLEQLPRGESAIIAELQRVAGLLEGKQTNGESNRGQRT